METHEKIERIPTGIPGLDNLIQGGFPRGSLIVVAGNPGSGKTIFSGQFLYFGAVNCGERGVYVSFAESHENFISNLSSFGFNFSRLEKEGKFRFLDMVTMKEEGVTTALETVINEIYALNAKRLVIDSFTAIAQAFKEKIDVRTVLHTILGKIVREVGCTTLLLVEVPIGEQRIGLSIEEFIADGIIVLETIIDGLEIRRRAIIRKMRGTEHSLKYHNLIFSKNGIIFTPMVT